MWLAILGVVALGGLIWGLFKGALPEIFFSLLSFVLGFLIPVVQYFFKTLAVIPAHIINVFVVLNPFSQLTFVPVVWEISKNIAYLVLIFLGLFAGYDFITGKEDEARRVIIIAIVVGLLINFTFMLAKEIFTVSWILTQALASYFSDTTSETNSEVGTAIYNALTFLPLKEAARQIEEKIRTEYGAIGEGGRLQNAVVNASGSLMVILLYIIFFIILCGLAGLVFGRFLIISFLVSFLPLVIALYALPRTKGYWESWWHNFLNWCFNLPILLLLVLVGISLIATTTSSGGDMVESLFLDTINNSKLWGLGDVKNYAVGIASILRFVFLAGYFVFVIILIPKLGSRFGEFGVDAGKWIWNKLGGLVTGLTVMPLGRKLSGGLAEGLDKAAETLGGLTGLWGIGGLFGGLKRGAEGVSESLRKFAGKEEMEKEARNMVDIRKRRGELGDLLREVAEGKHKRLRNELLSLLADEFSAEGIIDLFGRMDQARLKTFIENLRKNPQLFGKFNTKLKGLLTAKEAADIAESLAEFNLLKTNFYLARRLLLTAGVETNIITEAFRVLPGLLSEGQRFRLGMNPSALAVITQETIDKDIARGIRSSTHYREYKGAPDADKENIANGIARKIGAIGAPKDVAETIKGILDRILREDTPGGGAGTS